MYQLDMCLMTEDYENGEPKEDGFQDQGCVETKHFKDKKDAVEYIYKNYDIKDAEIYEGRIEWSCGGERNYRTPVEDRIDFIEMWSFYLSKVTVESIDFNEDDLKKIKRK